MTWSRVAAAALAAGLLAASAPAARAADADAIAVAAGPDAASLLVGGSAQFPNEPRSSVAGRWSTERGRFDWLERVDAAPGAADGFTALVPAGRFAYGIGYANGSLAVAKIDAATGTLQRSCGPTGVHLSSLGPAVLPGRAVAAGGGVVVAGATTVRPTRGFVAVVDGGDCTVRRSALVSAGDGSLDVGFTSVDLDASGNAVAAGFSGTKAAVVRFDGALVPQAVQTFDLGGGFGGAFTDVRVAGDRGVAVGLTGTRLLAQCFRLPALSADTSCGTAGLRSLSYNGDGAPAAGATLGRLPSGSLLVAGSHSGRAGLSRTQVRPALGAFRAADMSADGGVFAPAGAQVFDPFPAVGSGFTAVTAAAGGIAGVGTSGLVGSRRAFLYTSAVDGTKPAFTSLALDSAVAAPVEAAPSAPAAAPAAGVVKAAPPLLAQPRFSGLARRAAADGTFGFLTLSCRRACTARGVYSAPLPGARRARLGSALVRLSMGSRLRLRLALSSRGLRTLGRERRLPVTVRFVVTDRAGARQVVRRALTLRAPLRRR